MTIRLVTDSTCDLPAEVIQQLEITVLPMYINMGSESYRDQVDLPRETFYANLLDYSPTPKTAAPGPGLFAETYRRLADKGATEILSMHVAATISAVMESARAGAELAKQAKVTLFDSGQFSLGLGFAALKAAELAAAGRSVAQIVAALEDQARRTYMIAVVDTFEFLRRSGRVSMTQSKIGELLHIKPLLTMHQGEAKADKVRTRKRALERIVEWATNLAPLEQIGFIYTDDPTAAEDLQARLQHLIPAGCQPFVMGVTSVVGAHVGLGGVGVIAISAQRG
ncbi:MAG: DegV family protein [Chloroflexi bacterium]|nr:DegV family protein [Chloroflexota bacterium]